MGVLKGGSSKSTTFRLYPGNVGSVALTSIFIAKSSSGRTEDFESSNGGSNPPLASIARSSNGRIVDSESIHVGSNPTLASESLFVARRIPSYGFQKALSTGCG